MIIYECGRCRTISDHPASLCQPAGLITEPCDHDITTMDESMLRMCETMTRKVEYICADCGRTASTEDHLCRATKIGA